MAQVTRCLTHLTGRFLAEEQRLKDRDASDSGDTQAFVARKAWKQANQTNKQQKLIRMHADIAKKGHWERDSWLKKGKNGQMKNDEKKS